MEEKRRLSKRGRQEIEEKGDNEENDKRRYIKESYEKKKTALG